MPAGHANVHGEEPWRSMTAFLGTAWGKAMYAARRATRSALNWSGTATVHAVSHRAQPVHVASSTKRAFCRTLAVNVPLAPRRMPVTSL